MWGTCGVMLTGKFYGTMSALKKKSALHMKKILMSKILYVLRLTACSVWCVELTHVTLLYV